VATGAGGATGTALPGSPEQTEAGRSAGAHIYRVALLPSRAQRCCNPHKRRRWVHPSPSGKPAVWDPNALLPHLLKRAGLAPRVSAALGALGAYHAGQTAKVGSDVMACSLTLPANIHDHGVLSSGTTTDDAVARVHAHACTQTVRMRISTCCRRCRNR
jgi:hypothetical protein